MSGYDGEPEKMIPTWSPENHNVFEYGPVMRRLVNNILFGSVSTEDRNVAITRLCETAAVSDSVECRTALAQIAEIPFTELGIYKHAVGRKIGSQDQLHVERVIELALEAYLNSNDDDYDLLTSSVGLFPYPPDVLMTELLDTNV